MKQPSSPVCKLGHPPSGGNNGIQGYDNNQEHKEEKDRRGLQFIFWLAGGLVALLPMIIYAHLAVVSDTEAYSFFVHILGRVEVFMISTSMAASGGVYLLMRGHGSTKAILVGVIFSFIMLISGLYYGLTKGSGTTAATTITLINVVLFVAVIATGAVAFWEKKNRIERREEQKEVR
ncbi:MAG: hypothetical protein FWD82_11150 [Defluviitaleaceae bacterium]|nr:hypothetical protein [Defluviitaleaceae bacterium]